MSDRQSKILENLKCAFSGNVDDDDHICKEPNELKCGHFICKKCLKFGYNLNLCVECNICKTLTHKDDLKYDSAKFKNAFNENLSDLFDIVYKEFKKKIEYCKQIVSDGTESLTANIEFVKQEVEIRIESLKTDLDVLNARFNEELDEIKLNWEKNDEKLNEEEFENEFIKLDQLVLNINENNFYECQNKLRRLNNEIQNYRNNIPKVLFKPSSFELEQNFIGECKISTKMFENLIERIKEDKCNILNVSYNNCLHHICDCCILSNGSLLLADGYNGNLFLYNSSFELIKIIDDIDASIKSLQVFGLDCTSYNDIYLSEWNSNSIIKINTNFELLKTTTDCEDKIKGPVGICCYNNFVYVCSVNNNSIIQYNYELDFVSKYEFEFSPWYIKIIDDVACIRCAAQDSCIRCGPQACCIVFCDINKNFTEIRRHVGHSGSIGTYNSHFFEACSSRQTQPTIFCYNSMGELKFEFKTNSISEFHDSCNGSIGFLNSRLIICDIGYLVSF